MPETVTPGPNAPRLGPLRVRAEFLKAAKGVQVGTPAFHFQAVRADHDHIGWGVTASKKVGNAVARNRAKRRLREIARQTLSAHGRTGWNYVMVARKQVTAAHPFDALNQDLVRALRKVHG